MIEITKAINPDLLLEQLGEAFPGVAFRLALLEGKIFLMVEEDGAQVDLAAAQAVIDAHDASGKTVRDALLEQVVAIAQSAVGVRLDALTALQVRALVAVMLNKMGGVDRELKVKPLGEWAR